jgi:hypothetical protein
MSISNKPWEIIEAQLMSRINKEGILDLTMDDIREGATFESADLNDIKGSRRPGYSARKVVLQDGGRFKILKEI